MRGVKDANIEFRCYMYYSTNYNWCRKTFKEQQKLKKLFFNGIEFKDTTRI